MTKLSLEDIKKTVVDLALKINASTDLLPTYGYSKDSAYPHVEVDDAGRLHYVVIERGKEIDRRTTTNLDDLLYWIFADVTFTMSTDFELKNRIEACDCRRIMFAKQEELLGILSDTWRQKENEQHKSILKNHPFND